MSSETSHRASDERVRLEQQIVILKAQIDEQQREINHLRDQCHQQQTQIAELKSECIELQDHVDYHSRRAKALEPLI